MYQHIFRLAVYLLVLLFLSSIGACAHSGSADKNEYPNIQRVLGAEISGQQALNEIDQVFAGDNVSAYCCGQASCTCTDLGDCINLWFANVCEDIPGPDIVEGTCVNKSGCTNNDCSCPD